MFLYVSLSICLARMVGILIIVSKVEITVVYIVVSLRFESNHTTGVIVLIMPYRLYIIPLLLFI